MQKRARRKIERHLPPVGTILKGHFDKKEYQGEIVEAPNFSEGRAVSLGNMLYTSMTAAAKSVTKQSTNGWRFWKIAKP